LADDNSLKPRTNQLYNQSSVIKQLAQSLDIYIKF